MEWSGAVTARRSEPKIAYRTIVPLATPSAAARPVPPDSIPRLCPFAVDRSCAKATVLRPPLRAPTMAPYTT